MYVDTAFPVYFQGASFTRLYFQNNGFISFNGTAGSYADLTNLTFRRILIDSGDNTLVSFDNRASSRSHTFWYYGCRYKAPNECIRWAITFYNVAYTKFTIDIYGQSIGESRRGFSLLCSSTSCYQQIDGVSLQAATYWACPAGTCVSVDAGLCQPTSLNNCGECSYNGSVCYNCATGYALNGSSCVYCSGSSYRIVAKQCYATVANCATYSTTNPVQCTACQPTFYVKANDFSCTACTDPTTEVLVSGKCYTVIPNCGSYNLLDPAKCDQCVSGYGVDPTTRLCMVCLPPDNVIYQKLCYPKFAMCEAYSPSYPTQCSRCQANYTGGDCSRCAVGYFSWGTGKCAKIIPNCLQYSSGSCNQCYSFREPPDCQCIPNYVEVNLVCQACVSSCSDCPNGGCLDCSTGVTIDCAKKARLLTRMDEFE